MLIIYRPVHKLLSNNSIVLKFSQVMHLIKIYESSMLGGNLISENNFMDQNLKYHSGL